MASKKASGNEVIKLGKDDYEKKSGKKIPAGKYYVKVSPKSEIKAGPSGSYVNAMLVVTKGEHKGHTIFDVISGAVGWKIAQVLAALKKVKMQITLNELLKLLKGAELRVVVGVEPASNGYPAKNKIAQYLPLVADKEEDEDEEEDEDAEDVDDDTDEDEDEDEDEESDDDDDEEEEEVDDDSDDEDEDEEDEDEEEDDEEDDDVDEDDEDEDDDEDEEEDEEDEEEDEPAPPVKRGAKKTPAKKAAPAPAKTPVKKAAKKGRK